MRLDSRGECWFKRQDLSASSKPEYLGPETLARTEYARCDGHFYLHKKEPWLLFSSTGDYKPREIMKLDSHRIQIEQNFRPERLQIP